jgi:hypothetical protein
MPVVAGDVWVAAILEAARNDALNFGLGDHYRCSQAEGCDFPFADAAVNRSVALAGFFA